MCRRGAGRDRAVPHRHSRACPAAGTITDLLLPAVKAIFDLSAALTVGWLLAAAWLVPAAAIGILDVGGYRAIKAASLAATVWSVVRVRADPADPVRHPRASRSTSRCRRTG